MEEKNKKDISEMKAVAAVEVSEETIVKPAASEAKTEKKPAVTDTPVKKAEKTAAAVTETKKEEKPAAAVEPAKEEKPVAAVEPSKEEKPVAAAEPRKEEKAAVTEAKKEDEEEEEIVFAENTMLDTKKEAPRPVAAPQAAAPAAEGEESVVFAIAEKKPEKTVIPKQKEKKKFPVAAVVSIAAVLCVGAVGAVVAISASKNAVRTNAEPSKPVSQASAPSITVPSEPSKEHADVSAASEEPLEVSDVDTTNILFGENVTVEGVNLAGKSLTQAYDAMQKRLLELRDSVAISIACDGKTYTLTEDDFDYNSNLSDALVQAYHYSRGELNQPTVEYTNVNGVADFKVVTDIDTKSVDKAVEKAAEKFDVQPVDAHVTKFDPNAAEKFEYADGANGFLVNKSELKSNIESILSQPSKSGSFTIATKETPFKHSLKQVKANTKLISSHYTIANNRATSVHNMELALRAASGSIVEPGAIFSFNEMTGDTTTGDEHNYPNGVTGSYVESTAIVQGEYKPEYGGGICQASTTIYIAAMKANMEPIERYPHAYPSVYCSKGLDATIDYGNLDMKFKNNFEYPVYIATYVYDYNGDGCDELLVEFYGPLSTEYDEIVPVGWVDYAGGDSFNASAAKVFFKNGQEIKREKLISGHYSYKYDTYYSASSEIPADPVNGPSYVSPTGSKPAIYSPNGCGSAAPIEYGTAAEYLKKNT